MNNTPNKLHEEAKEFNDAVDEFTRMAHDQLLLEGGKGLRNAIFMAMAWARQRSESA